MPTLIADTSGLVSLGIAVGHDPNPLSLCLETYEVSVPKAVIEELRAVASHEDAHGLAATAVLERSTKLTTASVSPGDRFPMDHGEHATVALANDIEAELFLCDEFYRLGLIHASLTHASLLTTPTLLALLRQSELLTDDEAVSLLDRIGQARSWDANSYVERARSLFSDT